MRVSTSQLQQRAVDLMIKQQAQLSRTQQQVATGKRIVDPADDPAGATRAMGLEREIAAANQYQSNANLAYDRLAMEEDVLGNVSNLLQRVAERALQGNNDSLGADDRKLIAVELREQLGELVDLANSRSATGEYLFGGFSETTQPFTRNADGVVTYQGDQGQRRMHIGPGVDVAVNDSGAEVFQLVRSGNGVFDTQADSGNAGTAVVGATSADASFVPDDYTLTFIQATADDPVTYEVVRAGDASFSVTGTYENGGTIDFNGAKLVITGEPSGGDNFTVSPSGHQDIFSTVRQLAEAFESGADDAASLAEMHNTVNRSMEALDLASENILTTRAQVGSRLNLGESQQDYNDAFLLVAQETLASVQDLDYAEAISRLQQQITGLQAAQQTYTRIQGLSLFDYLG